LCGFNRHREDRFPARDAHQVQEELPIVAFQSTTAVLLVAT
jgi:hypothetical protein